MADQKEQKARPQKEHRFDPYKGDFPKAKMPQHIKAMKIEFSDYVIARFLPEDLEDIDENYVSIAEVAAAQNRIFSAKLRTAAEGLEGFPVADQGHVAGNDAHSYAWWKKTISPIGWGLLFPRRE